MLYKNDYPRPAFVRKEWTNLNGEWDFDYSNRPLYYSVNNVKNENYRFKINVPFPPESELSGINRKDFMTRVYYRKIVKIEALDKEERLILHFDAVFYKTNVYIDKELILTHIGGSTPFEIDITTYARYKEKIELALDIESNLHSGTQASGKQSSIYESFGCYYTRTTGIWQTVWLEKVSKYALKKCKVQSNINEGTLTFTPSFYAQKNNLQFIIKVLDGDTVLAEKKTKLSNGISTTVKLDDFQTWSVENPKLYDIVYTIVDNDKLLDEVKSYTGLREFKIIGNKCYLNGEEIYQRLVLDQGFFKEGIWTSKNKEEIKQDIELAKEVGFNGARLHQKVFEPYTAYYADKLGYLLWAEMPSWGLDYNNEELPSRNFLSELRERIERDINHVSIVAWTPLNETWNFKNPEAHRRLHIECYDLCKALDPERPVNDASGYIHAKTDLYTSHNYEQNPEAFFEKLSLKNGIPFQNYPELDVPYNGEPYLVDEYGGIKWDVESDAPAWGYGQAVTSKEEYLERLEGLTDTILKLDHICGYCYTQLYDVEQEKNGIFTYDRKQKFDNLEIKKIFEKQPQDVK